MKNPNLYEPKQRQPSHQRDSNERLFTINDLDVNNDIIQAEAVVRQEHTGTNSSKMPRSAKQVQLVKRAVSMSPENDTTKRKASQEVSTCKNIPM
jgi:hypothetical protein